MSLPLVSCIMPTRGRLGFASKAVDYCLRQTYPRRELVIVCDYREYDQFGPLEIKGGVVRVFCYPDSQSLGMKRNFCVEMASGDLIAHWDDDDWYGPTRLADQVALMQKRGLEFCGLDSPLFYDLRTGKSYHYHFADGCPYGATLMYTSEFWQRHPFDDIQVGETDTFIRGRKTYGLGQAPWFVGMIHDGNTCPKALGTKYFVPYPDLALSPWMGTESVESRLGALDWPFYQGLREKMGAAA